MQGTGPLAGLLGLLVGATAAQAQTAAQGDPPRRLDLRSPVVGSAGAAVGAEAPARAGEPTGEIVWRLSGLNLGMREEDGRIKGDVFVERGEWRLGLRPTSDNGALGTDGVMLRLSTRLD